MNNKGQSSLEVFGLLVLGLVLLLGLGFVFTAYDFANLKFWGPKYENAHRKIFENTQSYIQGKTEYLSRLRYQYQTATEDQKPALRTLILSEASTVDINQLPFDLQAFIRSLQ